MKQSDTRLRFVRANPGFRVQGRGGYWYRCAYCGKLCGRPGRENAYIPENMKMEVDHIRPWSQGGSDELWNLQPLCKPCNRNKSATTSFGDNVKMFKNDVMHGDIIKATLRKTVRQNKTLKKLGINKRK